MQVGTVTPLESNQATPTPVPIAFLVCDQVITDEISKKKTIVGIFDQILIHEFPSVHVGAWIYGKFIDGEGEYQFSIEFVQVATQQKLLAGEGTVTLKDRHGYSEFVSESPPLTFPEPGEYEFRLWMNKTFICSVRIKATRRSDGRQAP